MAARQKPVALWDFDQAYALVQDAARAGSAPRSRQAIKSRSWMKRFALCDDIGPERSRGEPIPGTTPAASAARRKYESNSAFLQRGSARQPRCIRSHTERLATYLS